MSLFDKITIENIGIPSLVLMENAGRCIFEEIKKNFVHAKNILIVAGKGNNGGDGLALARHLFLNNYRVDIYLAFGEVRGDAEIQLKILENLGLKPLNSRPDFKNYDLIVDAIFGTGFQPPVKGEIGDLINEINASKVDVISVDIPSGLSADTGEVFSPSIKAKITVTFQFPKICHVLFPAAKQCGKVVTADISIPSSLASDVKREILTLKHLKLYRREEDTYKTKEGHILIVGGSRGKTGAVAMSAKAATRTGAGLVSVGIPENLDDILETLLIEEMTIPLKGLDRLSIFSVKQIVDLQEKHDVLALGIGMERYEEGQDIVIDILEKWEKPILLDADGINNLADYGDLSSLKNRKIPAVLTPHIGEFSRLTGYDTKTIIYNQIELSQEFSQKYNCYLVLKGARTVISTPEGKAYVFTEGTPALAKGGTGDVLAGILSALMAKMEIEDALKLGVYIHGLSGREAEKAYHMESIKATDVIEFIPQTFRELEKKLN